MYSTQSIERRNDKFCFPVYKPSRLCYILGTDLAKLEFDGTW
jgi:hypothetical protein